MPSQLSDAVHQFWKCLSWWRGIIANIDNVAYIIVVLEGRYNIYLYEIYFKNVWYDGNIYLRKTLLCDITFSLYLVCKND